MRSGNLIVYTKSYELAVSIYKFSNTLPKEEQYGLTSQLRRASVSIPLNIAEGYGKQSSKAEFKRYLMMAKGSCCEMGVLLDLSRDLEYLTIGQHKSYYDKYEEIEKMLYSLIQK